MNYLKMQKDFQRRSQDLIKNNKETFARDNKTVLLVLCPFFTIIMGVFWWASGFAFQEWNVTEFYRTIFIVFSIISLYLLLIYRRLKRTVKQISALCAAFHVVVMMIVGYVSIHPVELRQPAVYFVPVAMGLCCAFTFSWHTCLLLVFCEYAIYIAGAAYFKPSDVFVVDLFSCLLGMAMTFYLSTILLNNKIKESEAKEKYKKTSMIDSLTGLFNKSNSQQMVTDYLESSNHKSCTYMIVDLDNFKQVNDTFGHKVGDEVLAAIGYILKHEAGQYGFAGRIGGDEFMVFLSDSEPGFGEEIAGKILRSVNKIKLGSDDFEYSCSIGIYYTTDMTTNYDKMYADADKALYRAKACGKNTFFSYDEALYQML